MIKKFVSGKSARIGFSARKFFIGSENVITVTCWRKQSEKDV
jgi:hypothetical protein